MGTQLENRPRYTPTTCFETFPFPRPTDAQHQAIAAAANTLNQLRENWLNPLDEFGRPYLEGSAELKRRTLTNLYNQNPTWLQNAHACWMPPSPPPMAGRPIYPKRKSSRASST